MKIKLDGFVLSIIVVIVLSWLFPQFGSKQSRLPVETISSIGVSLIFFFYGLKLSAERLRSGLKNWKLHALIHLSTFLLFPLLVLILYPFMQSPHLKTLWLGLLFLAALPSTVSSSVVMVSVAKGNVPAAIFNASISGLIGIVITPLWMGLFMHSAQTGFNLGGIYFKLVVEILLPVIMGISLQRYWGKFVLHFARQLSFFDKSVILLIIYKSFAQSFEAHLFSSVKAADLLLIGAAVYGLFYLVYGFTGFIARRLRFNREDEITARFCGTKKSLVHGTVFSKILFANSAAAGIVLLPLMLFHAFQLLAISMYALELAKRKDPSMH